MRPPLCHLTAAAADAAPDAADGGPGCSGTCVPQLPVGWSGPLLFALGPAGGAPACPPGTAGAGLTGYHGLADLDAGPIVCGECNCGGATGTCGPPPHLTASASPCADAGAGGLPFDPPPAWDGGCTSFDQIPQGNAGSVTIDALTLTDKCTPVTGDAGAIPPPTFATDVAACQALALPTCGDLLHVCAANAPAFRQCIFAPGEMSCPAPWTDQTLVTTGFDDERACAPCQCGAVTGSSCTGTLAIFNDTICGMTPPPQPFAQILVGVGSTKAACADVVPAGAALGSKTLLGIKYKPGTCPPSGGEPTDGGVTPTGIATFCCLP